MARLINHCRNGNTTMRKLCIVDLHVASNNIETLSVVMETQQWLLFVLLSSYKAIHTAVKNMIFLNSSQTVRYCCNYNEIWNLLKKFRSGPSIPHFKKNPSSEGRADTRRRTDGPDEFNMRFSLIIRKSLK